MKHEFSIVYEQGEDGWWVATALEYPGAFSQGKTIDEAREMVLDALRELMLAERESHIKELKNKVAIIREEVILELE